jgi:hypothetical protein
MCVEGKIPSGGRAVLQPSTPHTSILKQTNHFPLLIISLEQRTIGGMANSSQFAIRTPV